MSSIGGLIRASRHFLALIELLMIERSSFRAFEGLHCYSAVNYTRIGLRASKLAISGCINLDLQRQMGRAANAPPVEIVPV